MLTLAADNPTSFWKIAHQISVTDVFQRLRTFTFLGILSPAFSTVKGHPLAGATIQDHSRGLHSVQVAILSSRIAKHLDVSKRMIKYAIAWSMLHDIGSWPLSHTGEAAFSETTGVSGRELRRMIVTGDRSVDPSEGVLLAMKAMGVEIELLLALFDGSSTGLDLDLQALHSIIHSPLTPDTLDGIGRTGRMIGVKLPSTNRFATAFATDHTGTVTLVPERSSDALAFWRGKSKVYSSFINRPDVVALESAWSAAIRDVFGHLSLTETLDLTENEILVAVADRVKHTPEVVRYKAPLVYAVAAPYCDATAFDRPMSMQELAGILVKTPKASSPV